jgi:hypothetical protein
VLGARNGENQALVLGAQNGGKSRSFVGSAETGKSRSCVGAETGIKLLCWAQKRESQDSFVGRAKWRKVKILWDAKRGGKSRSGVGRAETGEVKLLCWAADGEIKLLCRARETRGERNQALVLGAQKQGKIKIFVGSAKRGERSQDLV